MKEYLYGRSRPLLGMGVELSGKRRAHRDDEKYEWTGHDQLYSDTGGYLRDRDTEVPFVFSFN
jgi:hypothetical protein